MASLPTEIMLEILSFLSPSDVANLCLTNTENKNICLDEIFWKNLIKRDFPRARQRNNLLSWEYYWKLYKFSKYSCMILVVKEIFVIPESKKYCRQEKSLLTFFTKEFLENTNFNLVKSQIENQNHKVDFTFAVSTKNQETIIQEDFIQIYKEWENFMKKRISSLTRENVFNVSYDFGFMLVYKGV